MAILKKANPHPQQICLQTTMPLDYTHKLIHTTPLHKPQVYAHSPRTLPIGKRTNPMHFVPNTHIIHPLHIHKFTLPPFQRANTEPQKQSTATYAKFTTPTFTTNLGLALNPSKDKHTQAHAHTRTHTHTHTQLLKQHDTEKPISTQHATNTQRSILEIRRDSNT